MNWRESQIFALLMLMQVHLKGTLSIPAKQRNDMKRQIINSPVNRWESLIIEYSFDGKHNAEEEQLLEHALKVWSDGTCLQFRRQFDWPVINKNRIVFTKTDACTSEVGKMYTRDPQFITTGPKCFNLGNMIHEIGHALGYYHEQNRPDRDKYITILYKNVAPTYEKQFDKLSSVVAATADTEYDFGSIMHYASNSFSIEPSKSAIITNIPEYQWTIGQREELSFMDAKLANDVYCPKFCENLENRCQRGGYPNPKDCASCLCPSGFSGTNCDTIEQSQNANCGGIIHIVDNTHHEVISSPNYPNTYLMNQKCSWLVSCPIDQHVKLEFAQDFDIFCNWEKRHCIDYVEVKFGHRFNITGPRFCCHFWPEKGILSQGNEMMIIFRSFSSGQLKTGFQARLQCI